MSLIGVHGFPSFHFFCQWSSMSLNDGHVESIGVRYGTGAGIGFEGHVLSHFSPKEPFHVGLPHPHTAAILFGQALQPPALASSKVHFSFQSPFHVGFPHPQTGGPAPPTGRGGGGGGRGVGGPRLPLAPRAGIEPDAQLISHFSPHLPFHVGFPQPQTG